MGKWELWKDDWRLGPYRRKHNVKFFQEGGKVVLLEKGRRGERVREV